MKYSFKKLAGSQIELEVILDQKEFQNYWQAVYDHELFHAHLKGFRPGTAPKELADKAVDKEKVFEQAVSEAARDNLKNITQEKDWQLVDQPKIEVLESDPLLKDGFKYKATLVIFPEIKLGDYRKVAKKIWSEKKEVTVADQEIEQSIKWILNSRTKIARVSRPAQKGDMVEVDYEGFLDGKKLDNLSGQGDKFVVEEGKFIPGFAENVLNHKEADQWEFAVNFPKDYWDKNLQEKKADFKIHLKAVFSREVPELTDEFVKGLGKFANVEEFKNSVKDGLRQEKEYREQERLRLQFLEEVGKNIAVDIPGIMIEKTLNNMVAEYGQMAHGAKSDEELRRLLGEKAKASVLNNLVLYQIAKDEKLEPTPEEVKGESDEFLAHSQFSRESKIDPQRLYDYIYGIVQNKKVFKFLEKV